MEDRQTGYSVAFPHAHALTENHAVQQLPQPSLTLGGDRTAAPPLQPRRPPSAVQPRPHAMATATAAAPTKLLFIHGYTQTGTLFRAKTGALQKALSKALSISPEQMYFPSGPMRLRPSDMPGDVVLPNNDDDGDGGEYYGWWRHDKATDTYVGIDATWSFLAQYLRTHGPFAGVLGFSQGAALAAMLAAALEPSRRPTCPAMAAPITGVEHPHPPLRFAICYSGYRPLMPAYSGFYEPKIATPTLHVIGSLDTVVEEGWAQALVDACDGHSRVALHHPGGHFVPSGKHFVNAAVGFIQNALREGGIGGKKKEEEEERVEDMEMPF